jgi:hypothetical protein
MALRTLALAVVFSASARNPRLLARVTASSSVVPLATNSARARDSVIQPSMATRPRLPSALA